MSLEAVNQFLQKVPEDAQLQEELAKAMESENDRQAATELAARYGYQFTPEELGQAMEAAQKAESMAANPDELSEEELEAVAGGATPTVVTTVAATKLVIAGVGATGAITASVISKAKW